MSNYQISISLLVLSAIALIGAYLVNKYIPEKRH